MIDPRISWLQTFAAVAEERHFGRAALLVQQTTSSVSRHIRQLEQAIGTPLFERTTRTVVLTPAGRRLYHRIAEPLDTIVAALGGASDHAPAITIGYVGAAAEHIVPALTWQWSRRSPVELHLVPASSSAQLEAIDAGTMDLGLQWAGPERSELARTVVLTEAMRVALPTRHPCSGRERVDLADLVDATWLMAADRTDGVVRQHLACVCATRGFRPRIKDAATGHAAQLHLVANGYGICLVPRTAIDHCRLAVTFAEIDGVHVDLVAITRPRRRPAVQHLLEVLSETTASLGPSSLVRSEATPDADIDRVAGLRCGDGGG